MSWLLALAAAGDLAFGVFLATRVMRSRAHGVSLRLRIFVALVLAMLLGAIATGLYATAVDATTLGFGERFARVAPKGFLVASALIPVLAAAAAWVGARLARPVEELSDVAARIAEGRTVPTVRSGQGVEAQKLARALTSMRREIADKPYSAASLRDAWHDLKTPLAAIHATIEVLEDGAVDDPLAARRFVGNLQRSADDLDHLLHDLVTLARFETSAIASAVSVDLGQLVKSKVAVLESVAMARSVSVVMSPAKTLTVSGDPTALGRALTNVLENAIAASPGGSIVVSVLEAEGLASIELTNEPSELPADLQADPFRRTSAPRKPGGSGLGLAIARAAIEAHGGRVHFTEMGPPRVTLRIDLPR